MGIISKIAKVSGAIKNKASSSIGALKASKPFQVAARTAGMISKSPVGRVATGAARFGLKVASPAAKIAAGVTVVRGASALLRRKKKEDVVRDQQKIISPATAATAAAIAGGGFFLASRLRTNNRQLDALPMAGSTALTTTASMNPSIAQRALNWVKENPVKTALLAAGVTAAGAGLYAAVRKRRKKKKSRTYRSKRGRRGTKNVYKSRRARRRSFSRPSPRRRRRTRYGSEAQYRRKGGLDVKYTRYGQPYVLTKSGKARFIKKSRG